MELFSSFYFFFCSCFFFFLFFLCVYSFFLFVSAAAHFADSHCYPLHTHTHTLFSFPFTHNKPFYSTNAGDGNEWPDDERVYDWVPQLPDGIIYATRPEVSDERKTQMEEKQREDESPLETLYSLAATSGSGIDASRPVGSTAVEVKANATGDGWAGTDDEYDETAGGDVEELFPESALHDPTLNGWATSDDEDEATQNPHILHQQSKEAKKTTLKPAHRNGQKQKTNSKEDEEEEEFSESDTRFQTRPLASIRTQKSRVGGVKGKGATSTSKSAALALAMPHKKHSPYEDLSPGELQTELWRIFTMYCVQGTSGTDRLVMHQFYHVIRDCKVVGPLLTRAECDVIFVRETQGKENKMSYDDFLGGLMRVAHMYYTRKRAKQKKDPLPEGKAFRELLVHHVLPHAYRWDPSKLAVHLESDEVDAVFEQHRAFLVLVFRLYSDHKTHMSYAGYLRFCKEVEIDTIGLTVSEMAIAFLASKDEPEDGEWLKYHHRGELDIPEFVEAIGRCALMGFSKSSTSPPVDLVKAIFLHMAQGKRFSSLSCEYGHRDRRMEAAKSLQASVVAMWNSDHKKDYLKGRNTEVSAKDAAVSSIRRFGSSGKKGRGVKSVTDKAVSPGKKKNNSHSRGPSANAGVSSLHIRGHSDAHMGKNEFLVADVSQLCITKKKSPRSVTAHDGDNSTKASTTRAGKSTPTKRKATPTKNNRKNALMHGRTDSFGVSTYMKKGVSGHPGSERGREEEEMDEDTKLLQKLTLRKFSSKITSSPHSSTSTSSTTNGKSLRGGMPILSTSPLVLSPSGQQQQQQQQQPRVRPPAARLYKKSPSISSLADSGVSRTTSRESIESGQDSDSVTSSQIAAEEERQRALEEEERKRVEEERIRLEREEVEREMKERHARELEEARAEMRREMEEQRKALEARMHEEEVRHLEEEEKRVAEEKRRMELANLAKLAEEERQQRRLEEQREQLEKEKKEMEIKQEQNRIVSLVQQGDIFSKHGRKGKPHPRFIQVSDDNQRVYWGNTYEQLRTALLKGNAKYLEVSSISQVGVGTTTKVFSRLNANQMRDVNEKAFSLIAGDRTLDLVAASSATRNLWTSFFEHVVGIPVTHLAHRD